MLNHLTMPLYFVFPFVPAGVASLPASTVRASYEARKFLRRIRSKVPTKTMTCTKLERYWECFANSTAFPANLRAPDLTLNSFRHSLKTFFVHTDDTCSALETFSDSGLYKFTFYVYIYIYLHLQHRDPAIRISLYLGSEFFQKNSPKVSSLLLCHTL